jgi:D-beta-D-heptose 7-phosphate kinase/D-beta-D-heptose 1-phosphate adenosyltransferase
LRDCGVHTGDVLSDSQRPTTTKLRIMASSQQMLRIDRERSMRLGDEIQERLIKNIAARIPEVDGVICSDYAKGVLTREVLSAARSHTQTAGKMILADPKGSDYTRYVGFDLITPNLKELHAASHLPVDSEEEIVVAGRKILGQIKGDGLLVTRGKDGMTLLRAEQPPFHIPTAAQEVFDVTGAGDTVLAVFAMGLFAGVDAEAAAQLANRAAGIGVAKVGAVAVGYDAIVEALEGDVNLMRNKILNNHDLTRAISQLRGQGKKIVFTNGCYDLLHVGHIKLLQRARALGDVLVIGLNSDDSIRTLKGPTRPLVGEKERAQVMAALDCVDLIAVFPEETPMRLIEQIQPDILVKGGDYEMHEVVGRDFVESRGGRVELVPIVEGFSTTDIVKRIVEKYRDS